MRSQVDADMMWGGYENGGYLFWGGYENKGYLFWGFRYCGFCYFGVYKGYVYWGKYPYAAAWDVQEAGLCARPPVEPPAPPEHLAAQLQTQKSLNPKPYNY